jgi:hypothetical protein
MYHGRTRGTSPDFCDTPLTHANSVHCVFARENTADAYAIGFFIYFRSDSLCMQSGLYFANWREFLCFKYISFFYSLQHIPASVFRS